MLAGNNSHANVNIREQPKVLIVDHTGGFSHIPRAQQLHRRRNRGDRTMPGPAGNRVPRQFYGLPLSQAADVGLVDIRSHQHFGKIGLLQHQVAGIDVRSLMNRQGIDNSIEGGANIQLAKDIFGRLVSALGFVFLRFNAIHFGLRVTLPCFCCSSFRSASAAAS